jgi:hypothetical protein
MLKLEYINLEDAQLWDRNPKKHDLNAIAESIERYGFNDPPKYDSALKGLIEGNGRTQALRLLKSANKPPPRGIALTENGNWAMPVIFGNDFDSVTIASAYAIDHNNLTLSNMSATEVLKIWDADGYMSLLEDLGDHDGLPVTVNRTDLALLMEDIIEEDGGFSNASSDSDEEELRFELVVICDSPTNLRKTLIELTDLGYEVIVK